MERDRLASILQEVAAWHGVELALEDALFIPHRTTHGFSASFPLSRFPFAKTIPDTRAPSPPADAAPEQASGWSRLHCALGGSGDADAERCLRNGERLRELLRGHEAVGACEAAQLRPGAPAFVLIGLTDAERSSKSRQSQPYQPYHLSRCVSAGCAATLSFFF